MTTMTSNMSEADSRLNLQQLMRQKYRRRVIVGNVILAFVLAALAVALIPLLSIVVSVIERGSKVLSTAFLTQVQQDPFIFDPYAIGGVWNAIVGSLVIDGIAIGLAIPIGIFSGVILSDAKGKVGTTIHRIFDVMIGLPSILFGLFVFFILLGPVFHDSYSGMAGVIALTLMSIPLITVATESAISSVPPTLNEAGLALGALPSRVMWNIKLPAARPAILTGVLLALSRAVGETAPVLFVIGQSREANWNPTAEQSSLPTLTFQYLQGFFPSQREAAWGIALILMIVVFLVNLTSRIISARSQRG